MTGTRQPPSKRARSSAVAPGTTVAEPTVIADSDANAGEDTGDKTLGTTTCDLACFIDKKKTSCANEDAERPHTNALVGVPKVAVPPSGVLLVSNCDPQLLLEVGFTGAVNLQRLSLGAPGDGRAPRVLV